MPLIIIMIFVLYTVVVGWMWNNLGEIDKIKKLIIIFVEILVMYLLTLIIFNISKSGINYTSEEIEGVVRNTIVILFTGFNSLIVLPFSNKHILMLKDDGVDLKMRKKNYKETRHYVSGLYNMYNI